MPSLRTAVSLATAFILLCGCGAPDSTPKAPDAEAPRGEAAVPGKEREIFEIREVSDAGSRCTIVVPAGTSVSVGERLTVGRGKQARGYVTVVEVVSTSPGQAVADSIPDLQKSGIRTDDLVVRVP